TDWNKRRAASSAHAWRVYWVQIEASQAPEGPWSDWASSGIISLAIRGLSSGTEGPDHEAASRDRKLLNRLIGTFYYENHRRSALWSSIIEWPNRGKIATSQYDLFARIPR